MRGQFAGFQRGRREFGTGCGGKKIATEAQKEPDTAFAHRLDGVHRVEALLAGRLEPELAPRLLRNVSPMPSEIPMVRSPWTLLWPRTGQAPAPGRPIFPLRKRKYMTSSIVATEFRCCVSPICLAADDAVGLRRDPGGLSNLLAGQAAGRFDSPQIASAKFFDECVESHAVLSMKDRSKMLPGFFSSTASIMPFIAAKSPLMRTGSQRSALVVDFPKRAGRAFRGSAKCET